VAVDQTTHAYKVRRDMEAMFGKAPLKVA